MKNHENNTLKRIEEIIVLQNRLIEIYKALLK